MNVERAATVFLARQLNYFLETKRGSEVDSNIKGFSEGLVKSHNFSWVGLYSLESLDRINTLEIALLDKRSNYKELDLNVNYRAQMNYHLENLTELLKPTAIRKTIYTRKEFGTDNIGKSVRDSLYHSRIYKEIYLIWERNLETDFCGVDQ
jgi:hypothetical protein